MNAIYIEKKALKLIFHSLKQENEFPHKKGLKAEASNPFSKKLTIN